MTDSLMDQILGCPDCGAGERFVVRKYERDYNVKNALKGAIFGGIAAGPFAPIGALIGGIKGSKLGKGDIICNCTKCGYEWRTPGDPDEDYRMRFR